MTEEMIEIYGVKTKQGQLLVLFISFINVLVTVGFFAYSAAASSALATYYHGAQLAAVVFFSFCAFIGAWSHSRNLVISTLAMFFVYFIGLS